MARPRRSHTLIRGDPQKALPRRRYDALPRAFEMAFPGTMCRVITSHAVVQAACPRDD